MLEIDGTRAHRYASQYFDTPALDSYFGAARGRRRRFKVRTRTYVDAGGCFLEVKTRGGRAATVKERVPVDPEALDRAAIAYAAELLTDAEIPDAAHLAAALVPTLATGYRRATLLLPPGDAGDHSRATIDTDLTWHCPDGVGFTLPGALIVETKSGQRPGSLDRALWRLGHRPASVSKYATGMAVIHPHLPAHRWHRTLTRHFCGAVARMLHLLDVNPGDRVLDVGSGSGWTTAILSVLAGELGTVLGVELVPELVDYARAHLADAGFDVEIRRSDASELGLPADAPFDRILVSAEASALPQALVDQLADGGRLVVPVRGILTVVDRDDADVRVREDNGRYNFVPLR